MSPESDSDEWTPEQIKARDKIYELDRMDDKRYLALNQARKDRQTAVRELFLDGMSQSDITRLLGPPYKAEWVQRQVRMTHRYDITFNPYETGSRIAVPYSKRVPNKRKLKKKDGDNEQ